MKWVYSPCAGVVRPGDTGIVEADTVGHTLVLEVLKRKTERELVVVAPVSGKATALHDTGFTVDPGCAEESRPVFDDIDVTVGGDGVDMRPQVEVGDVVKAGQALLRGRIDPAHTVRVRVNGPDGRVLCSLMDSVVYTAEPLLHIAREEVDVVEINQDGSVSAPKHEIAVPVVDAAGTNGRPAVAPGA